MNKITEIALSRPYTFVVLALLILLYGGRAVLDTPTDVFPNIRMPVVAVVWTYSGMLPADVSGRITFYFERALTSTVEGVERLESHSYYGSSIIFIYLRQDIDLGGAEAEIAAISQTIVTQLPPDISPPMIMRLEPSSVPVAMLQVTSDSLSPAELYNLSIARIRPQLVVIPGAIVPHPYGGKPKMLLVSLDRQRLVARHLTADDVHRALRRQGLVLPAGDQKIDSIDWMVQTNASPMSAEEFNDIPIKRVGNAWVYLRDVANAGLAGPPQTNAVLVGGKQAVTIVVMKSGQASTLDVVDGIRRAIPQIKRSIPSGVDVRIINDASVFVRDSVLDVIRELSTAAALAGLVVLLFLGSWRATVIVATSIPLSILAAVLGLHWLGESMNIMTLGGLALAVGILVDNSTVMVENIDTHRAMKKPLETAILDAAEQILVPSFVATLCIMAAWLPLFGLSGVSGWLFAPMAKSVILSMAVSFVLSRTLVPTMAKYMLVGRGDAHQGEGPGRGENGGDGASKKRLLARLQQGFGRAFDVFRERYRDLLEATVRRRRLFIVVFLAIVACSLGLFLSIGREFFPEIRSGTLQMHMRAPLGTRIETASRLASRIAIDVGTILPGKVESVVSNCGLPVGPHNLAFIPTPTIGTQDCDLTIGLRDEHSPVWTYRRMLRRRLTDMYPGTQFTFQPADLTAKILNFGSPSPITVEIKGMDVRENYAFVRRLASRLARVAGARDVVIQQTMSTPTVLVEGNRTFGLGVDITEADMATNQLLMTAGSRQIDQHFWLDRDTGLSYQLNVYTPQPFQDRVEDLLTVPVSGGGTSAQSSPQLLGNVASLSPAGTPGVVTHEDILPVFDIYVAAEDRALGSVLHDVEKVVDEMRREAPRSAEVTVKGQAELMRSAYAELLVGLAMSVVLVYLLIVVNFQSWLDPFIIITALPGALAGIAWALFTTRTNVSVPALTGAIMSMGTATANSILLVSYAKERRQEHGDALRAAVEAGHARVRPVLMTASAMILGMLPMAMGNSTNAPLGRAVMGGLAVATVATLFFVPSIYALLYGRKRDQKTEP